MKTRHETVAMVAMVCSIVVSNPMAGPAGAAPDSEIQKQMGKAGAALVAAAHGSATNVLKDLKGDQVPPDVKSLEQMAGGDRIALARQLAYFMTDARTNQTCGFQSVALFAYFWFTPEEMERATHDVGAKVPQDVVKELLRIARQQHPTQPRTVPPSAGASGGQ